MGAGAVARAGIDRATLRYPARLRDDQAGLAFRSAKGVGRRVLNMHGSEEMAMEFFATARIGADADLLKSQVTLERLPEW